jgi:predicted mannosyl-3-phosphoglycerate phosphatase (HAD superfamily)
MRPYWRVALSGKPSVRDLSLHKITATMHSYIFLDLDDTLFQTLRKCPPDASGLQVRATLADGTPNSFATPQQQWLWDWLEQGFKIVAVTARDVDAFNRVRLPFQQEVVLNHGAVILTPQRTVDAQWHAHIMSELPDYQQKLLTLWSAIEHYCQRHAGYKLRLVNDFGITWYGVLKHCDGTETPLMQVLELVIKNHPLVLSGCLYWHLNGNNLAILPNSIRKENAVRYLLTRYKKQSLDLITFAAGDSYSDAPFLSLCDYAIIPKNTQLASRLTGELPVYTTPINQVYLDISVKARPVNESI